MSGLSGKQATKKFAAHPPPFIATTDDLTDVLDFDSEGIGGMDDDARKDSESLGR